MTVKILLACVLGLISFCVTRAADPVTPGKAKEGMTDERLEEMLKLMGYEYKITGSGDSKWIQISVTRSERDTSTEYTLTTRLAGNGTMLWSHVALADLTPEQLGNAEALQKLLELNDKIGPNVFRINPKTKRLFLSRGTDTRGLTPVKLREHIDRLLDDCVETRSAWDTSKWGESVKK
jgi:hypothetical protein